ncbi:hypothetical protein [Capnocytophaga canis]|uniref:hypothetical protein n=1 Tax=Capnocytophaga canis TaxID=1848903 RepID=UPI0037CCC739
MILKEEARKKIKKDLAKIAYDLDKSPLTVNKWIYACPHLLKKRPVLKVVKKHTGLDESDIFESEN